MKNKCSLITKCFHHEDDPCTYFRNSGDDFKCIYNSEMQCVNFKAIIDAIKSFLSE
jgi:hypothetical protein